MSVEPRTGSTCDRTLTTSYLSRRERRAHPRVVSWYRGRISACMRAGFRAVDNLRSWTRPLPPPLQPAGGVHSAWTNIWLPYAAVAVVRTAGAARRKLTAPEPLNTRCQHSREPGAASPRATRPSSAPTTPLVGSPIATRRRLPLLPQTARRSLRRTSRFSPRVRVRTQVPWRRRCRHRVRRTRARARRRSTGTGRGRATWSSTSLPPVRSASRSRPSFAAAT